MQENGYSVKQKSDGPNPAGTVSSNGSIKPKVALCSQAYNIQDDI